MTTQKQPNWAEWFINNPNNEAGNSNLQAFSDVLGSEVSIEAKIRDLVDEIDTVILIADANRNIMLLHSPKKIWRHKVSPRQQGLVHDWSGSTSNNCLPSFKLRSRGHSSCCPVSSRTFRMRISSRRRKHPSDRSER
jgi:hypothetical protein